MIYYQTDLGELHYGDCFDILPNLNIQADLILTDPPYNISSEVVITRGRNKMKFKGKDINLNFGKWDKFTEKDYWKFTWKWIDLSVKLLRPGGMFITFFDRDKINFISYYLQKRYNFKMKGYYAMIKLNPVPQCRKTKWMNGWEILGMWQKPDGKLTYNYKLGQSPDYSLHAIVGHTTKANGVRVHATQKPVALSKKFIMYWSNKNDLILDPFAGSGTNLVACEDMNRHWIGIEREEKYCKAIIKRLKDIQRYPKLWR